MSDDDIEYYRDRAIVERGRAKSAPSEEIAAVHQRLADLYEKLINEKSAEDRSQTLWPPVHTPLRGH